MADKLGRFIKGVRSSIGTEFKKGISVSPQTQFKKGISASPKTQFAKGHIPANKKSKILVTCKQCNEVFLVRPYRKDTATFCSPSCRGKFNMNGQKHPQWKGGKPECSDCGKVLTNYNNKKCVAHKGLKGVDSPVWKGGKGTERHRLMGQRDYKIWRKAVFERDNYTCQFCNVRGVYLEADHIKSWAEFPELRYAIDNGRTLCIECHRMTESYPKQLIPKLLRRIAI